MAIWFGKSLMTGVTREWAQGPGRSVGPHVPGVISPRRAAFFSAILLCFSFPVQAGEEEEWHYPVQPGDNLWNISEHYLKDMGHWDDLVKRNGIKRPRQIPPGTMVRIPLQWLRVEPAPVTVLSLRGEVTHLPAHGSARELSRSTVLQAGDGILVGPGSSVLLEFDDGTRTTLGPGTEAYLRRTNRIGDGEYGDTVLEIRRGGAETRVPRRGTRFEIITPAASTTVRGTRFRVHSREQAEDRITGVEVLKGQVKLANPEGGLNLPAGFGTRVAQGNPPEEPARLLPAPVMDLPKAPIRALPLDLRWKGVEGATGYHALLFEGQSRLPLVDRTTEYNRLSVEDLPDGRYRLEVRALDRRQLEGQEGAVSFILDARPFAPLTVAPAEGLVVRTPRVTFEWSVPPDADSYRFQLARDSVFKDLQVQKETLKTTRLSIDDLPPGRYFWRVATRSGDETGPWGTVHSFDLRPAPQAPALETQADSDRLVLRWQAGKPGQRYRVQMAEDEAFTRGVVEQVFEQPQWSMKRPAVPVFFRVRTIDTDGYEGAWGPVQKVFPPPEPWYIFGIPALLIMLLAL